jgi:hypothetical protein
MSCGVTVLLCQYSADSSEWPSPTLPPPFLPTEAVLPMENIVLRLVASDCYDDCSDCCVLTTATAAAMVGWGGGSMAEEEPME